MTRPGNGLHRQLVDTLEDRINSEHSDAIILKEFPFLNWRNKKQGEMDLLAQIGNNYLVFEMKCHNHEEHATEQLHKAEQYIKENYNAAKIYLFYVCYADENNTTYRIKRIKNGYNTNGQKSK